MLILNVFEFAAVDPSRAVQAVLSNSVSISSTLNGEPSSSTAMASSSLPIDNFLKPDQRKLFAGILI